MAGFLNPVSIFHCLHRNCENLRLGSSVLDRKYLFVVETHCNMKTRGHVGPRHERMCSDETRRITVPANDTQKVPRRRTGGDLVTLLVVNGGPCTSPSNHAGTSRNCCKLRFEAPYSFPRVRSLAFSLSILRPNLKAEMCHLGGPSLRPNTLVSVRREKPAFKGSRHPSRRMSYVRSITWAACAKAHSWHISAKLSL
jgi:hypothetical protein